MGPSWLGLLAMAPAWATTYTGGDQGGADLILADGDELSGVFSNVGELRIPGGARVTVAPLTPLEIHAQSIVIDGLLDATGGGDIGGVGAPPGAMDGEPGEGLSPGEGGEDGPCVHGGGGGGAGHGGRGGDGGHYYGPQSGFGGLAYGSLDDPGDKPLGSGGGGAGSDCYHPAGDGAAGGGSITLTAPTITVTGAVRVDGETAEDQITGWSGGGGGGSAGTVVIYAGQLDGGGQVTARGGDGGSPFPNIGGHAGGGGGGAGGRIKAFFETLGPMTFSVAGGVRGLDQDLLAVVSTDGANGTLHLESTDLDWDGDGVELGVDNCPFDDNPTQDDTDGDGLGDPCDSCPLDVDNDSDLDGVCDSDDLCPGSDDSDDRDDDGQPDDCDDCPDDATGDSDGDGVCDSDDICAGDDTVDTDADGFPDDCDNCPDDANVTQYDTDLDGLGDACDCAPTNPVGGEGLVEVCDGVDNDCDELVDESGAEGEQTWYADNDSDGQGDPGNTVVACDPPPGYVDNDRDCNDTSSVVGPFQTEFCDGLDNDCDGVADPPELNCDGDGDEEKGGCGCATPVTPGSAGLLALAALVGLARRR